MLCWRVFWPVVMEVLSSTAVKTASSAPNQARHDQLTGYCSQLSVQLTINVVCTAIHLYEICIRPSIARRLPLMNKRHYTVQYSLTEGDKLVESKRVVVADRCLSLLI